MWIIRASVTEFRIVQLSRFRPALAVALIIGLLPMAPAAAAEPAPAAPSDPVVVEEVSAAESQPALPAEWVEAATSGEPVEIVSRRTADSRTLVNPDGTLTSELYAGTEFVRETPNPALPDTGRFERIDVTLVDDGDVVRPVRSAGEVALSRGGSGRLAAASAAGRQFTLSWPGTLPAPVLDGSVATYRSVMRNADLEVEATAGGFKWRLVLHARTAKPIQLDIPLGLVGLTASQTDTGQLVLTDADGEQVVVSEPALMWGAAVDPRTGDPARTAAVTTQLLDTSGGQVLRVTPDMAFINDQSVSLPIVIDPNLSVAADTFTQKAYPSSSYGTSTELKAGTYNSGSDAARSFIKFGWDSRLTGSHILDSKLYLWNWHSYSCNARTVLVRRLTESFSNSTTWSTTPNSSATGEATRSFAHGYSSSCPDAWGYVDIDAITQAWANGTANYGVTVRALDETDSYTWKKFNSADAGSSRPYMAVTYNSYPNTPSGLSPASGHKTTDLTPPLTATYSDPDGGSGTLQFQIARNSDGVLIASGSKTGVTSGSAATWSPGTALTSQVTYKWRVRAYDGTDYSAWTAYRTITPDNTAPAAPSISSTTHPTQSVWYANDDPSLAWSASDPTGIVGYAHKMDKVATTDPGTTVTRTATSITYADLSDGVWYLHLRAKDGAGNWSAIRHFAVRIDDTAPAAPSVSSSTHPSQTTYYVSNDPSFSWSASDVSGITGYSYTIDRTSTTTPDTTSEGTSTTKAYTDLANGEWWFHVRAKNGSGLWSTARHYKVLIDTVAPSGVTISSTTHPDPAVWGGSSFSATWTASADSLSGVAGYAVKVDQTATTAPTGTLQTTTSYTHPTALKDGLWYLHVRPKDKAGNWGPTAHYKFGVDTGSAAVTNPEEGQTLQGTVTLEASSSPSATGATFEVYTGGDPAAAGSWRAVGSDTAHDGTYKWHVDWNTDARNVDDSRVWPNGPYRVRVVFSYTDGSSRAVVGPLVTVDDARLGIDGAWSFHDLGVGAQVNIATGNVIVSDDDVNLATATGGITVARTYNSRGTGLLGPLGWGWDFSLPTDVAPATWTGLVIAERDPAGAPATIGAQSPDGDTVWFLYDQTQPTPTWVAEASELGLQLAKTGVGAWTLTDLDGTVHTFQIPADWIPPSGGDADAFDSVPVTEVIPPFGAAGGVTYGYHPDGRLKSVTDTDSSRRFDLTWIGSGSSVRVDTVTAAFDSSRVVADYDYDSAGRLTAATGRDGLTTTYTYHGSSDLLATITPPGLQPVRLDYDPGVTGRLTASDRDHDTGSGIQTARTELTIGTPDTAGNLTAIVRTPRGVAASDTGSDWTYQFDAASRTTAITAPGQPTRHSSWSTSGQLLTSQTAAEAAAGDHTAYAYSDTVPCVDGQLSDGAELCTTTGPLQTWQATGGTMVTDRPVTRMFYDTDRLLVRTELPDGTAVVNGYDTDGRAARQPNTVTTLAPDGTTVSERRQSYDSLGRVVTETMPKGITSGNLAPFTTTFAHGPHGQLTSLTRPGTAGTTTVYDDWSQPTAQTAGSGTTTFVYDAATGRLTSTTDPDGRTTTYGYATTTGLPTTASDPSGTVTTGYDDWGRVVQVTDGSGETTSYGHDLESNVVSRTDRHGTVDYTVDRLGQVTAMVDPSGSYGFGWATDGTLATTVLPNGITATATARPGAGDVESLIYSAADGTGLGGFVRTYDPLGRLVAEVRPTGERQFGYDVLGRLVEALDRDDTGTLVQTRTYGYDANSNRTTKTVTDGTGATLTTETYTVDDADRLTSRAIDGTIGSYTYDAAGNTLTGDGRTYTWTGADRIEQITGDVAGVAMVVDYTLDPLGRTLTRTETADGTPGPTSRSHYADASDNPAWTTTTDGGTDTTLRHVTGPAGLLAQHTVGADTEWLLTSPHGETWAVTDATGDLVRQADADEFGTPLTGPPDGPYDGWLGRQQRAIDTTFGLTLMGVRLYQPDLGRFLTTDPVHGGSATDYDYCNADPINCYDLDGLVARPDPSYLRRLGRTLDGYDCTRRFFCGEQRAIQKAIFYYGMAAWSAMNMNYFQSRNVDAYVRYNRQYNDYYWRYTGAVVGIGTKVAAILIRQGLKVSLRGARL